MSWGRVGWDPAVLEPKTLPVVGPEQIPTGPADLEPKILPVVGPEQIPKSRRTHKPFRGSLPSVDDAAKTVKPHQAALTTVRPKK
jgi:hypothetical protein